MYIQPLIEGKYFHIYNRGINGENIFKEKRNYYYFLQQFEMYCINVLDVLSYCLLKNHFHMLVFVKENVIVSRKDGKGAIQLSASKQLSHFFNSYTQSINKAYRRTGSLFESPFERKLIDKGAYLFAVIRYCHRNAQQHGFVEDFRQWEHSSYGEIINNNSSLVLTKEVVQQFGGLKDFENFHHQYSEDKEAENFFIEK